MAPSATVKTPCQKGDVCPNANLGDGKVSIALVCTVALVVFSGLGVQHMFVTSPERARVDKLELGLKTLQKRQEQIDIASLNRQIKVMGKLEEISKDVLKMRIEFERRTYTKEEVRRLVKDLKK